MTKEEYYESNLYKQAVSTHFGWAITKNSRFDPDSNAPSVTVFTFTTREDAESFRASNECLAQCEIYASYEMAVPPFGTTGVQYEIHTRQGGGCGTTPAGLMEYPHWSPSTPGDQIVRAESENNAKIFSLFSLPSCNAEEGAGRADGGGREDNTTPTGE